MATNKDWKNWRKQTLAVRGGQRRTPFQETSEALFMTAGYAYEGAEEAEERFKGAPGYTYTRYANPTVSMFEERMALLEGAPEARATASGMAAVTATFLCCLKVGRPRGGGARPVRRHPLRDRGGADPFRHHPHDRGRARPGAMAGGHAARDQAVLLRDAVQSRRSRSST